MNADRSKDDFSTTCIMSFLRGSLNYVWCTTSVLGKGATGAVFQVRHTRTHINVVRTIKPLITQVPGSVAVV